MPEALRPDQSPSRALECRAGRTDCLLPPAAECAAQAVFGRFCDGALRLARWRLLAVAFVGRCHWEFAQVLLDFRFLDRLRCKRNETRSIVLDRNQNTRFLPMVRGSSLGAAFLLPKLMRLVPDTPFEIIYHFFIPKLAFRFMRRRETWWDYPSGILLGRTE